MKLRISNVVIAAAIAPLKFTPTDVLSMVPKLTVGQFQGCAINLACYRTLVVTKGLVLTYCKLEDFLAGLEPLSLVEDETIYYDQELGEIDFKIMQDAVQDGDAGPLDTVRSLMFGARVNEDEAVVEEVPEVKSEVKVKPKRNKK